MLSGNQLTAMCPAFIFLRQFKLAPIFIHVSTLYNGAKPGIDQQKFLLGNRLDVKLRILGPKTCKRCLQVKS